MKFAGSYRAPAVSVRVADPDGLGILDDVENVIGEGFFHCQHYMIHRKGTVQNAYSCGTRFRSHTFAR